MKNLLIKLLIIAFLVIVAIYNFFIYNNSSDDLLISNIEAPNLLENNAVSLSVSEIQTIKIYITGEVKNPGVIELNDGARIEDAIITAGGITDKANLNEVNLAYFLEDGQKIYIPNINEVNIINYISTENGDTIIEKNDKTSSSLININKADINQLQTLPGVGESLAQKIIEYRNANGKFNSVEDLKNVSGIGDKKFEKIKEFVKI